jgi:hypothetical protein
MLHHNSCLPKPVHFANSSSKVSERAVSEFFSHYASLIGSFIAGLIGGGTIGSLLTLRITGRNRLSGKGSVVDQSRSKAGGDIVGKDKTTTGRR